MIDSPSFQLALVFLADVLTWLAHVLVGIDHYSNHELLGAKATEFP